MTRALFQRTIQKHNQMQRSLFARFADPAFVREYDDFFEHFFEHDDIMSDDGFLFGEKFSKGKRSLDYDATKKEQGRTGKKAKATWISRSIENASEQRDGSQEAKETQSKCYRYHSSSTTEQGKTKTYTKRVFEDEDGHGYEIEERILPSGEALISQKKHENGKTEESHTLVNSLENKKVNASNESVALFNSRWDDLVSKGSRGKMLQNNDTPVETSEK